MSNLPTTTLPDWQHERLTLLLDALDGVSITDAERISLTWLSAWELRTAQNVAAVITRDRQSGQAKTAPRAPATTTPAPSPAYTELSNAITRALRLTREAGNALISAGQSLTGLSGALADVVAAVAAMPELAAVSREASEI